ncbi:UNVERIFIED_CONTAM: hypothetical protein RMT77_017503 [Armadillidium vulgare]
MSSEEEKVSKESEVTEDDKAAVSSNNNSPIRKVEEKIEVSSSLSDSTLDFSSDKDLSTLKLKVDDVLKEESKKEKPKGDPVNFKVVYNKTKYDIEFPLEGTVKQLKEHLAPIINVLPTMQKVMIKGLAKDDKTLQELGVIKGAKLMVVGSKLNDVVNVNVPKSEVIKNETVGVTQREPLCKQKMHRKVLDKGIPEDALPGIKNCKEALPLTPLTGMVNKHGGKVRLTFKLELDQVWLGTKERTEKINMSSIQQIVSEKIEEHEEYHVMGLQLGPTEASRYWIYWVPAQYVDAIKDTVLGKW